MMAFRLHKIPVTTSTNAEAKRAAEAGEPEGLVIQALRQTAGQGRQGRVWDSPEGNLYASLLLRPHCGIQEAGNYTFVAALAVYDTVREFLPEAVIHLKWPNDVLVEGRKISGILLEAAPVEEGRVPWLVIGVGINVLHCPDTGMATSLHYEMRKSDRFEAPHTKGIPAFAGMTEADVLTAFLNHFALWQKTLVQNGFAPLRSAWLSHAKTGLMTIRLPRETLEGTFSGLNDQGHLIVTLANGAERAIAAGDVFFPSQE